MFVDDGTVHKLDNQVKLLRTQEYSEPHEPLYELRHENIGQNAILQSLSYRGDVFPSFDDFTVKNGVKTTFESVKVSKEGRGLTLVTRGAL